LILPVVSDLKPLINHPYDVLEPFVGPLLNVIEVERPVLRRRRFDLFDGRPMRNLCVCTLLIFSSQGGPCPLRNSLTSSPRQSRHPGHTLLRKMLFSLFIISLRSGFALCSDPAGRAPAQHPPLPLLLFSAGGQTESEGGRSSRLGNIDRLSRFHSLARVRTTDDRRCFTRRRHCQLRQDAFRPAKKYVRLNDRKKPTYPCRKV